MDYKYIQILFSVGAGVLQPSGKSLKNSNQS